MKLKYFTDDSCGQTRGTYINRTKPVRKTNKKKKKPERYDRFLFFYQCFHKTLWFVLWIVRKLEKSNNLCHELMGLHHMLRFLKVNIHTPYNEMHSFNKYTYTLTESNY